MVNADRKTNHRWWICGLLFFATTINYVDRQTIALLKPGLSKELSWTENDYGSIVFWFQAAYAAGYLFAGRLMDIIGVRKGYALSVAAWSLAAAGHALVSTVSGFCGVRAALGLAEGGNFPAAIKTVSEWFPKRERAFATGLFNAGSNIGAIVAPIVVPWVTVRYGWRAAFIVTGSFGILWLVAWLVTYVAPARTVRCNAAELAFIQSDPPDSATHVSWIGLLRYRATWAYIIAVGLTSPIWWFYLFWGPDFLNKRFGVDIMHVGPPLIAIYLISDVGSIGGGWLSSFLISRNWSLTASRKTALLTFALLVVPVIWAAHATSLWVATALVGLAAAGHQGWSANLYTLASDSMPRRFVSSLVGMGGMVGAVAGMFFAKFVGNILTHTPKDYIVILCIAPCGYLLGFLAIHLLVPKIQPAVE